MTTCITQTQPRKGLDNHSPSAAVLRTGAQLKRKSDGEWPPLLNGGDESFVRH